MANIRSCQDLGVIYFQMNDEIYLICAEHTATLRLWVLRMSTRLTTQVAKHWIGYRNEPVTVIIHANKRKNRQWH